jgi:hypothetical protein
MFSPIVKCNVEIVQRARRPVVLRLDLGDARIEIDEHAVRRRCAATDYRRQAG